MSGLSIAEIRTMQTGDTNLLTDDIYFRGCSKRCPYCLNPEIQEAHIGSNMETRDIIRRLSGVDTVCLIGGEPMEQNLEELQILIDMLRWNYDKKVVLFTSYDKPYEQIAADHYHVHVNPIKELEYETSNIVSYGYVSYNTTIEKMQSKFKNANKNIPIYVKTCFGWEDLSKAEADGMYLANVMNFNEVHVDEVLQL